MHNTLNITWSNENKGYAPGLALQVSGVSNFFGSVLDCILLLLSHLLLLDRFGDQLVGDFGFGVYTNKICHAKVKMVQ